MRMRKFGTKDQRLVECARSLRARSTDVERKLWYRLRDRQIAGTKFRRQHPIAGYVIDFACEALRLGVELDGGQHNRSATQQHDVRRSQRLSEEGWLILRFWNNEVTENFDGVLMIIHETILARNTG